VDRLACVNVIALPLQLLAHRHPDWLGEAPMAVVDRDEPDGTIEWVDRRARRARIRPGMGYAEGLSIRRDLRAGTVEDEEVDAAVDALVDRLRDYSPFVEPADDQPGIFWLDTAGLDGVFDSLDCWAEALEEGLRDRDDFYASIVVGFTRFGTYALARSVRRRIVFAEADGERRAARQVPLQQIGLPPKACRKLERLGVETVGQFARLPPAGVRRRFDGGVVRLHQMARGDLELPLQAELEDGPIERSIRLDDAVEVTSRLIFIIKRELNPLFVQLADGSTKIVELTVELFGRDGLIEPITIRPATPTVEASRLMELIRLKIEDQTLEQGVDELVVRLETSRSRAGQLQLFADSPARDLADANRALERLRAEFGREAVVCAVLEEGHLPEAQFRWEPFDRLDPPDWAVGPEPTTLARRLWRRPRPLRARQPSEGQLEFPDGRGVLLAGPYIISGGWWVRRLERRYYFAERPSGELQWLYWDARRNRWFTQGRIE
jgi:protein ImuB